MSNAVPVVTNQTNVGEFLTDATLDALNAALAARHVDASQIISILAVAGQPLGNGVPERYRVLYRLP